MAWSEDFFAATGDRRDLGGLRRLFASGHHNLAGADGLNDFKLRKHTDDGVDDLEGLSLLGLIGEEFRYWNYTSRRTNFLQS